MSNIPLYSVTFDLLLIYITSLTSPTCFNIHNICITFDPLLLAPLESAYSLIWGSHKIWGKADWDTLDLLRWVGLFNRAVIGGNLAFGIGWWGANQSGYHLGKILQENLMGNSCRKILRQNPAGNSCGKILWEIVAGNSCGKILQVIRAGKSCPKFLWEILAGKSCGKFLQENLAGNSCGKILREILAGNSCTKFVLENSCMKIL